MLVAHILDFISTCIAIWVLKTLRQCFVSAASEEKSSSCLPGTGWAFLVRPHAESILIPQLIWHDTGDALKGTVSCSITLTTTDIVTFVSDKQVKTKCNYYTMEIILKSLLLYRNWEFRTFWIKKDNHLRKKCKEKKLQFLSYSTETNIPPACILLFNSFSLAADSFPRMSHFSVFSK